MTPQSKRFSGYKAKIQSLSNGRVVLSLYNKDREMEKYLECDSVEEAKQLLQLSGQQFQKVQETIIYVVKE